jgi:hyaluronan synthase
MLLVPEISFAQSNSQPAESSPALGPLLLVVAPFILMLVFPFSRFVFSFGNLVNLNFENLLPVSIAFPKLIMDQETLFAIYEPLWLITIIFLVPTIFLILFSKMMWNSSGPSNGKQKHKVKNGSLPKISVVIPNYGEGIPAITATVKSVARNGYKGEIELFVINDGKWDDETLDEARNTFEKYETNKCIIIVGKNPENIGKSETLNRGFVMASGKIYLCVDADSRLKKGSLGKVVEVFLADPKVGAAGGWVQIRLKGRISKLQEIEYWTNQYMFRTLQNMSKTVLTIPGPLSALRAEVADELIESTGEVFSSRTVVEDEDLTKYIVSKGHRTVVVPEAVVYTDCPKTLKALVVQRKRWFYGNYQAWRENKVPLLKKSKWGFRWAFFHYYTWITGLVANLFLFLAIILAILFPAVSMRFLTVIGAFLLLRGRVLIEHPKSERLMKSLPLSILYDAFLGLMASYLFLRYLLRVGVTIRWGGRNRLVH